MSDSELIIGILCTAVFFLLIIVIALGWKSFQHSESLKRHERSVRLLSRRNNKSDGKHEDKALNNIENDVSAILRETKGFTQFCKYACWVLIPICLIAAIHHFVIFFPRLLSPQSYKQVQLGYAHLGIDYLGVIVAIFAIIVTLLVTWQIFSTIKAKEELKETQREIKENLDAKINNIRGEILSVRSGLDAEKIREAVERNNQLTKKQQRIIRDIWEAEYIAIVKTNLYKWVEARIKENVDDKTIVKEWAVLSATDAEQFSYIDGRQATLDELSEVIRIAKTRMSK